MTIEHLLEISEGDFSLKELESGKYQYSYKNHVFVGSSIDNIIDCISKEIKKQILETALQYKNKSKCEELRKTTYTYTFMKIELQKLKERSNLT